MLISPHENVYNKNGVFIATCKPQGFSKSYSLLYSKQGVDSPVSCDFQVGKESHFILRRYLKILYDMLQPLTYEIIEDYTSENPGSVYDEEKDLIGELRFFNRMMYQVELKNGNIQEFQYGKVPHFVIPSSEVMND